MLPEGPRHGGANIKVIEMIQDIKSHLHDWTDPDETSAYLRKLLNKEAFDHSGLIYGMGHAALLPSPTPETDPPLLREPAGRGEGPPG